MSQNQVFSKLALGLLILTFCVLLCSDARRAHKSRKCGPTLSCKKGKVCVKKGPTYSCKNEVLRPVQQEQENCPDECVNKGQGCRVQYGVLFCHPLVGKGGKCEGFDCQEGLECRYGECAPPRKG